jgi:Neuraminidase (sialidase)
MSTSTDGGLTWGAPQPTADAVHGLGGQPVVQPNGRVVVPFEGGTANDIVYSTSADGVTWSPVTRIPADPVGSGTDHFIPGLAVNPITSGAHTQLALTYYFDTNPSCTGSTCQIQAAFTSSIDNGATWSTPDTLGAPMQLGWLAPTSQGVMVGDYISTSFLAGEQRVIGVFAAGSAPGADGTLNGRVSRSDAGVASR